MIDRSSLFISLYLSTSIYLSLHLSLFLCPATLYTPSTLCISQNNCSQSHLLQTLLWTFLISPSGQAVLWNAHSVNFPSIWQILLAFSWLSPQSAVPHTCVSTSQGHELWLQPTLRSLQLFMGAGSVSAAVERLSLGQCELARFWPFCFQIKREAIAIGNKVKSIDVPCLICAHLIREKRIHLHQARTSQIWGHLRGNSSPPPAFASSYHAPW